ncbi:MAG: hypothetical protein AB7W16_25320 [Candidatus Obscuribacterales bacterium]
MVPFNGQRIAVYGFDATTLGDGRILISGGSTVPNGEKNIELIPDQTWIFDSQKQQTTAGPRLKFPRINHRAIVLNDGRVLITGGIWKTRWVVEVEAFSPKFNDMQEIGRLVVPRINHELVQLSNGEILIVGGETSDNLSDAGDELTSTVELFREPCKCSRIVGQLHFARIGHKLFATKNGALVVGGFSDELQWPEELPTERYTIGTQVGTKLKRLPTVGEVCHRARQLYTGTFSWLFVR